MYMVGAPMFAGLVAWGFSKMRQEGGMASHFAHAISQARQRVDPSGASKTKWRSKKTPPGAEEQPESDEKQPK